MDYRRIWQPGGTYFFTINLLQRKNNDMLVQHIQFLRDSIKAVKANHPFKTHGWVVLPEHMHCLIELPANDTDYATRIRLIKMGFSKAIPKTERRSAIRIKRGERGIWQRRYWEHLIRDEADFQAHLDYIHYNPVKHGWVKQVKDWPYSTFYRWVERGVYPLNWAGNDEDLYEFE
ncbi:transposase [Methylomonas koyamae]|uniref:Transposase n=1 Tax=Methylomonas koyamae TaxID=702114 RepID=A0A177NII3_9GAMM|nr:transposase [Methylomonas koyamae]OAI17936.1 transposase [Methylomonas koyamae]